MLAVPCMILFAYLQSILKGLEEGRRALIRLSFRRRFGDSLGDGLWCTLWCNLWRGPEMRSWVGLAIRSRRSAPAARIALRQNISRLRAAKWPCVLLHRGGGASRVAQHHCGRRCTR